MYSRKLQLLHLYHVNILFDLEISIVFIFATKANFKHIILELVRKICYVILYTVKCQPYTYIFPVHKGLILVFAIKFQTKELRDVFFFFLSRFISKESLICVISIY